MSGTLSGPTYCESVDEAIAIALEESAPGDTVEVHESGCEIAYDDEDEVIVPCSCSPMVLVVGASA